MKYIPEEYLPKLREYAYRSIDISPLTKYVMQPYWNFCVKFLPLWMAPNLVTLIGFAVMVSSYLLIVSYCSNFGEAAPAWVYLYATFALQFYSLFDNLDGKQARRTGTSSPLGELFDHGCDSITCVLIALVTLSSTNIQGDFAIITFLLAIFAFWLATWEEYHTGVFFLGYVNGPTEGIQILAFVYFCTYYFGTAFWQKEIGELVSGAPTWIGGYRPATLVTFSMLFPAIITLYYNYKSVADHAEKNGRSKIAPLREIIFFFFIAALILISYFQSPHLWDAHPHIFYLFFGLCFGELTHRLILAHVTKQRYALLQRPLFVMILAVVNTSFKYFYSKPFADEITFTLILLVVQILLFTHYFVSIVAEICAYLNIKCLTIPYKGKDN